MRRLLKWSLRIVGVAGVVAAVLLALYVTVLPGIVERRALAALREMGLTGASLEVRAVSLGGAEAANVRLDEQGRVRIYSLAALYDLAALRKGRVGTIEVTGAEMDIALRDGKLDLGPLADIQGSGEEGDLPFDRILLRSSALRLDLEGRKVVVPVYGSIRREGESACRFGLRADAEGAVASLSGSINTSTQAIEATLEGEVRDLAGPLSALPPTLLTLPWRHGGRVTFEAYYKGTPDKGDLSFEVTNHGAPFAGTVAGRRLTVESLSWTIGAAVGPGVGPTRLGGGVTARGVAIGGLVAHQATLGFLRHDQRVQFWVTAEGDGWRVEKLEGHVKGLLAALDGTSSSLGAEASWSARARLPAQVVEAMAARGIDLAGLGEATATGRATLDLSKTAGDAGEGWTWKAAARGVRVTLAPGRVRAAVADADLRDITADLRLRGDADAESVRIELLPESQVAAREFGARAGGATVASAGGAGPAAMLQVGERPATLRAELGSPGSTWKLEAPDLRLGLQRGKVALLDVSAEGLALKATLRLVAGPGTATCSVLTGSRAWMRSLDVERLHARVAREEDEPPILAAWVSQGTADLRLAWGQERPTWSVTVPGMGVSLSPTDLSLRRAGVALKRLAATATVGLTLTPEQASLAVEPASTLTIGAVETEGTNLRVTKAGGEAPLVALEVCGSGLSARGPLTADLTRWSLAPSELLLAIAPADVCTVDEALRIAGVEGTLPLRLKASRGTVTLSVPEEWRIGLRTLDAKVGDETLHLGRAQVTLNDGDARPLATVAFGGGEAGLRVAAQARTAGPVAATVGEETAATVATLRASAEASRDPEGTSLAAELVAEGIDATVDRAFGGLKLVASTKGGSVRVSVNGRGVVDEVGDLPLFTDAAIAAGKGRVAVEGGFGRIDTSFDSASLSGWAGLEQGRRPTADARLTLRGASCKWPELQVALSGLSADVPVRLNTSGDSGGTFAVGGVRFRRSDLPGLSGTLAVTDGRVDVGAAWPLLKDAVLHAEGRVDLGSGVPLGTVRAWMPRVVIEDEMELAGLLRDAQGIDLSGAVELDATLELLVDRVIPHVVVKTEDVTVGSKQYDTKVEGLTATITLNSLTPLGTPSHQRIEVARANVGGLAVKDGVVDFRLESLDAVFIERCEFGWAGGRLYTYALRFNPAEPVDLVVYGEKLSLGEMLALIPEDRAAGKGTLYGRLPVTVSWPHLRFGEGFLYGTPGERGWVSLEKDAALLASGLPAAGGQTVAGDVLAQLRSRLEAALKDFEYDVLKADFVREGGDLVARVALTGRGPEVKPELPEPTLLDRLFPPRYDVRTLRQEFAPLVLRFPRIDETLSKAIIVKTGIEREAMGPARKGGTP